MILLLRKIFFIFIIINLRSKKNLSFVNLNFRKTDFTNYKNIKSFIFKKNFYKIKNRNIHSFDFLNFSNKLGGKIGINLSKDSIFGWFSINKNKINYPWSDDLASKRLINLIYNYEYIKSSSKISDQKKLDAIIFFHIQRNLFDFNIKKFNALTSFDIVAFLLSSFILNKITDRKINFVKYVLESQIDKLGMHKSYNILEHTKFISNLNEIKNIFLFFNIAQSKLLDDLILKMSSTLNQYFHDDGTLPLFNGTNNVYTNIINESVNKENYFRKRDFTNINNGIAFYSDKNKRVFFDVVQPNKDRISSNLNAGTLSFEISGYGEKIFTNCGASESLGKNPEYLRYSAAHSTIILQNTNISEIREGSPHTKFPQSVSFRRETSDDFEIFEGSHNGYLRKFNKIIKRKLIISKNNDRIDGEDSVILYKNTDSRLIYHIRFHMVDEITFNFTNNKKNIILKTKLNNIWLFKSDMELIVEDSILVDNNTIKPTKQIVMKGIVSDKKIIKKWSLEKI